MTTQNHKRMFFKSGLHLRILLLAAVVLALGLLSQVAYAHGISEEDKQAMLKGGYLQYVWLGASHMLTGYDHLLFLFGVMFFLVTRKDIVRFVSVFTLGHSITLIFATFSGITANYFLIDAVIALSVCYKGFDNNDGFENYLGIRAPNILRVVFAFGLLHGFGLSTRLQQLPLGEKGSAMLGRIVSFNVGVELGQVAALIVMVAILGVWRKRPSFERLGRVANHGLIVAGLALLLMQMHGYAHATGDEHLAASSDLAPRTTDAQNVVPSQDAGPSQDAHRWRDSINITVAAHKDVEYKFEMKKGATLEYAWKTDGGKLFFDFHGEPTGDTSGYFKSFEKNTASESSGELTAPFSGIHGWYWKNDTQSPVVVTLRASGEYQRTDLD